MGPQKQIVATFVTLNVRSLEGGQDASTLPFTTDRISWYKQQFFQRSAHVINIQEPRSRQVSLSSISAGYLRLIPGPSEDGVELWISTKLPWFDEVCLRPADVHLIAHGSRFLLAYIRTTWLHLDVFVAHAPGLKYGDAALSSDAFPF